MLFNHFSLLKDNITSGKNESGRAYKEVLNDAIFSKFTKRKTDKSNI
jgi:hypothetical protein